MDLYDTALIAFGYGSGPGGYPGTPNNDTHIYAVDRPGDTRPVPICVPDWTDANDWAYIVDPRIFPVICMAYGDNPGGTSHPAPQLYSVTDPPVDFCSPMTPCRSRCVTTSPMVLPLGGESESEMYKEFSSKVNVT